MPQILRFLFLLLVVSQASILTAKAGDFSQRQILGFSQNGGLFAFEEYGRQDGSGFPYATIYVIDTQTDKWTAGSPFRTLLNDETKTIYEAREATKILAGPVMKSFEARGNIVATNRVSELSIDKKRMVANPRIVVPPIDTPSEFRLDTFALAAGEECKAFGDSVGFRLKKIATTPDEQTRIIHEDRSIPASRNCPLDYEFADLVTYYPSSGQPKVAILIRVKSVGFEGPNGRYLATVTTFSDQRP